MRRAGVSILTLAALMACAKQEEAKPDSAAAAVPPPPAALTEADIAGTWTGTAMMAPGDSVFAHWTQVCAGGACTGTSTEAPKDTAHSTYTLAADSSVGVTTPQTVAGIKGKVIDHWVARTKGGVVSGTGFMTLADKPDSVVMRYRFEGTRKP